MTAPSSKAASLVSDAELAQKIRAADRCGEHADQALEELYRRHHPAVLAYARTCCRDAHTAEDLTSEAFTRTLHAVRAGHGPQSAWRPYLLSVVRRTAADWASTTQRADLSPDFDHWLEAVSIEDGGEQHLLAREEDDLVLRGFQRLPERWQTVLWHTVVEGEPAEQVAAILGIGTSGVNSLAARAREGLREAYLTAHIQFGDSAECRHFSGPLAAVIRRGRRPGKDLARHLDHCPRCRGAVSDLTDLNARIRTVLPGALLIWAPPSYVASHLARVGRTGGTAHGVVRLANLKASAVTAASAVLLGGYLLIPHSGASNHSAQYSHSPSAEVTIASPPSKPAATTIPSASTPTLTGQLPTPAAVTRLRIKSTGRCMQTLANPTAEPYEATCDGSTSQMWELVRDAAGRLQLRNQASKLCLTYPTQLPDGAVVRQATCGTDARGQWWGYLYSSQDGTIILYPRGDNLRRLGLNAWNIPGTGKAYDPTIGVTANYYNTPSLMFIVDGTLFR